MIRVALGSVPKDGGTFTFYRNIRPALLPLGVDLRCVTLGRDDSTLWEPAFADAGCVRLAAGTGNLKAQAHAFVDWCGETGVDIVIGLNSAGILSALPHLPERIRVVARCANGFDLGYRITMSCAPRLSRIIALTPRLERDLQADYGADPERTVLIPNGIDPTPFDAAARLPREAGTTLQLAFLGRLEHAQKGVLHLPGILRALHERGVSYRLRIAGKGRHEAQLRRELADELERGSVEFVGTLLPSEIPKFLQASDAFLFTSHFEGCPNALLEAMMAGAVPVCWRVEGITDFLVADGETGILCSLDHYDAAASRIGALHADRALLARMQIAAARAARERFSIGGTARAYADLFAAVMAEPPPAWVPTDWCRFQPDPNFRPGLRAFVPRRYRGAARNLIENARLRLGRGRQAVR